MMKKYYSTLFPLILICACSQPIIDQNSLEKALTSTDHRIKRVVDSLAKYEVQIRFTQIDRKKDSVLFTDFDFQVDENKYFYPASTVKFPTTLLVLEKLNEMDSLDRDTRFYVEGDSIETTFAKDISNIFSVSDNDAYNRLFEFLGQDVINEGLRRKGIINVRISHRLGVHEDDIVTKPLIIYLNDSTTTLLEGSINQTPKPLNLIGIKKGVGLYEEDSLINEPFDFSLKNYYPIDAQHSVLKRFFFPEKFPSEQRFNLNKDQRKFIVSAMNTLPKNLGYDPKEYYDGSCKFFMFGDTKDDIPENIKIYNKAGWAYGTLTDCAYIVDEKNKVEFMLTATILVNKNGIFNDDRYEFDEIGIPFLAQLGREIYAQELNRKK